MQIREHVQVHLPTREKLFEHACNRTAMSVRFGRKQNLKYAGQYLKNYGDIFNGGKPWNKWWGGILKRNPNLKLEKPELTAGVHRQGMEGEVVHSMFDKFWL